MYTPLPIRIFYVDSDSEHAKRVADQLASSSDPIEVTLYGEVSRALDDLANIRPDAMVMDLQTALAVASKLTHVVASACPDLCLVLRATRLDDPHIAEAMKLGATAVLAEPVEAEALLRVLHAPAPASSFQGTSRGIPSALLVTLHCASGSDGVLCFKAAGQAIGTIGIEAGQPIHASVGNLVGVEAVRVILSWPEAEVRWILGHTGCGRTIVGSWEGLLARPPGHANEHESNLSDGGLALVHPEVIEKLSRLSQTPDILGAFLLRHAQIVMGRCVSALKHELVDRALSRLAHVHHDLESMSGAQEGQEIQATCGDLRLVLDGIGPRALGFQVGVVVRQASPVCKSLRRLIRQIDRSFHRAQNRNGSVRAVA